MSAHLAHASSLWFAVQWGYCNNCGPPLWHASLLVRVWQVLTSTVNVLLVRISTHPSSVVQLVFSLHRYTAQIDWSHFSMMGGWVQFQEVVYQKLSIPSPTCFGLSLFYLVLQPAELHAHCFWLFLFHWSTHNSILAVLLSISMVLVVWLFMS